MKKKTCIVVLVVVLLFGSAVMTGYKVETHLGMISPRPYAIYVNDEKVEGICAYRYQGHTYVPVLAIIEICGYEVNRVTGENPSFVIDGKLYQLDFERNIIYTGDGDSRYEEYLNDYVGVRCSIDIEDNESYVLGLEMENFFERIGKEEQIQMGIPNFFKKMVNFKIDKES